ncbi:hypothetical protein OKW43_001154 [Paraburkholderia sp. WC7.3g]|uniref:Uncharacterized protein n=1 Tax=Paraburkholderia podalyriae TaxID=1938811 RepID=A0ABR7PQ95_9BURK|nr:hypothetical protein [Paraburkholderia podalyriae]MBC8748429.1 hypothetical protein [Paraburkholderia podalyriae]
MQKSEETWGWDLATNGESMAIVLGGYPSFHDSAVSTFSMRRGRQTRESVDAHLLPDERTRELVDVQLEVLHNRYGPASAAGRSDYVVVLEFRDVRTSEIDVNAMLEEATIMEMTLSELPDGLLKLDLMPNVGLDVQLTCKEAVVTDMHPYVRDVT